MIKYMPNLESFLWARKSTEYFETIEDLIAFVADQRTRFYRFIGQDRSYLPQDVKLVSGKDMLMGWKNYHTIVLDGRIIGFCGE